MFVLLLTIFFQIYLNYYNTNIQTSKALAIQMINMHKDGTA